MVLRSHGYEKEARNQIQPAAKPEGSLLSTLPLLMTGNKYHLFLKDQHTASLQSQLKKKTTKNCEYRAGHQRGKEGREKKN